MSFPDPTALSGVSEVTFDPTVDRVPSTGELVVTRDLAREYHREINSLYEAPDEDPDNPWKPLP